jgi:hypothetical protein
MKFVKWLTQYNKFLVALTMAMIYFLQDHYQVTLPIDEDTAASFWMFVSAILTFAVPNTKPEKE